MLSHVREICFYLHHNLPLGVTNEEVLSTPIKLISGAVAGEANKTIPVNLRHQVIFGAVAGDSKLQDRGVAHYLLPLLFSVVSLPFSLYFCLLIFYQKVQKIVVYFLVCFLW